MIISITGASGSGKSTLASILEKRLNAVKYEVDCFFREAFLEHQEVLKSFCGENCINDDGTINFGVLAKLPVSKDLAVRKILRARMDEMMSEKVKQANLKNQDIIFDYLFLTDCKTLMNADLIIVVDAPLDVRYKRMLNRDKNRFKFTKEEFEAMNNLTGATISKFTPDIIVNNSKENALDKKVENILNAVKQIKNKLY